MNSTTFLSSLRRVDTRLEQIWTEEFDYDGVENTYIIMARMVDWILDSLCVEGQSERLVSVVDVICRGYSDGDEEVRNLITSEFLVPLAQSHRRELVRPHLDTDISSGFERVLDDS